MKSATHSSATKRVFGPLVKVTGRVFQFGLLMARLAVVVVAAVVVGVLGSVAVIAYAVFAVAVTVIAPALRATVAPGRSGRAAAPQCMVEIGSPTTAHVPNAVTAAPRARPRLVK